MTVITAKGSGGTMWLPEDGWDDLRFPAAVVFTPGIPSNPDRDTTDGCFLFDPDSEEYILGQAQLPHSWKKNSAIIPHIHWQTTDPDPGDTRWVLRYQMAAINADFAGSWTEIDNLFSSVENANTHLVGSFADPPGLGTINPGNATVSLMIKWQLSRDGAHASDTYPQDAKLLELDFHYQLDSLGSGEETFKV